MNALSKLWGRLRAVFSPPSPPAPKASPLAETITLQLQRALELFGPKPETRGEYVLPTPLPGVLPAAAPVGDSLVLAMDGGHPEPAANDAVPAAWGFANGPGNLGPGVSFLGFPYLAELQQITEYRTPCEELAADMTRNWLRLKNKGKDDKAQKIREITERMEELRVREHFREAALHTEQFGRGHMFIDIQGEDDDRTRQTPLLVENVQKGSLIGFRVVEPYWITPFSWNSTFPERPDFYRPQSWYMLGRKTHHTRLMTFIFREVPDLLKPAYSFSGISMTQLMIPYVSRWLRTAKNVNDLINIFSIVTLHTDMMQKLAKPEQLAARIQLFTQTRDNRGLLAIDKNNEELSVNDVSLSSLDKLQAQAQEHMATPSRTSLIKFFGITPTGLNASSEGERQVRAEYVKSMQVLGFNNQFERVLQIVQMDLYGTVDDAITHEWLKLDEPSKKEEAELRKADAERDAVYLDKSVVSPEEIREKLQMDPESGYDGLEGPPPEPPEVDEEGEQPEAGGEKNE